MGAVGGCVGASNLAKRAGELLNFLLRDNRNIVHDDDVVQPIRWLRRCKVVGRRVAVCE